MKLLALVLLMAFCAPVSAQPYVQASVTGYDSNIGSAKSISAEAGYVYGPFDISGGVFDADQRTKYKDLSWSGLFTTATAHLKWAGPTTAFAAYQISDGYDDKFDGRYAVGFAAHLDPFKLSFFVAPHQQGWNEKTYDTTYGLSIKFRWALK